MGSSLLLVVFAVFLVLLNGFFVAAEFGLVKLRATRVKAIAKTLGWRGRLLAKVHAQLDTYLSACQLGITLASLGLGWVGEPAFAGVVNGVLAVLGIESPRLVSGLSFFAAFFLISYLHIVVGELAPKSWAIRQPERIGLLAAPLLYGFYWLMKPAIWLLNHSAASVLRRFKLDVTPGHEHHYSAEELKIILRSSRANNEFTTDEWRVLAHALDFRNLDVADLMRPINEVVVIRETDSMEASLARIAQHRFSRYPFVDGHGDIKGVVHLKDVFIALQGTSSLASWEGLVRPVKSVPADMSATDLFRRFREGAPHFAVVTHWDGRPMGFLTLDNMLGALVGEIRDEFRHAQNEWTKLDDGSLIGKGSLPIFTLERALGIDIDEGSVDSVGGLVMQALGDLPEEGQRIEFPQFTAVVKKMNGPRIVLVRIYATDDGTLG